MPLGSAEPLDPSTISQVTTGALAYPWLGWKLKRSAVVKAVDAAFKETESKAVDDLESKVESILEMTEMVNENIAEQTRNVATKQQLEEMNERMGKMEGKIDAKMNELNEKMDAILAAFKAGSTGDRTSVPGETDAKEAW